ESSPVSCVTSYSTPIMHNYHMLYPPVTARHAEPDPPPANPAISSRLKRNPAAIAAAMARAPNPDALAPRPMFDGKSFTDAIRNGARRDAFARIGSTTERILSMSRAVTSRPSIVARSRGNPPNSIVVRVVRGAVHTLIESWNGRRRIGSARPWYLISPWIGWATAVAFIATAPGDAGVRHARGSPRRLGPLSHLSRIPC